VLIAQPIYNLPAMYPRSKKSLLNLAVKQGLNGGWEFAKLSFPC